MTLRSLTIKLSLAWLALPFIATILVFLPLDELSLTSQIISTTIALTYCSLTAYFTKIVINQKNIKQSKFKKTIILSPIAVSTIYFIYLNCLSKEFSFTANDSPFDQIWYSWPQVSYGYPSPFLRIFKEPLAPYGNHIFDISSLFFNFTILAFAAFIWSMISYFFTTRLIKPMKK